MGQPCGCCRVGARRELRGGLFGRRGEGDGLSGEALELADQVVLLALRVDAGLVEVGAEVVVADLGVGQRVPDDRQYRVADRDDGALFAAVFGQAPVALGEEGVGAAGGGDDLAEGAGQPRVALAGGGLFVLAGGLAGLGGEFGLVDQVRGGWEKAAARGADRANNKSRTRVLKATMRGPSTSSQRQTFRRAHQRQGSTEVDGQPAPFSARQGKHSVPARRVSVAACW